MSVTIVVPNHNEPMIEETVQNLLTLGCPVVVSHDPEGKGIGWAIREGVKEVQTEWVLFAMADGSEDLGSLAQMISLTDAYTDAVFGNRWDRDLESTVAGYPRWKRILNRLGNHLITRIATDGRGTYTDWTDLAKCYRTDRLRRIHWSDDFRCAVEIPLRYGASHPWVVPMHWRERSTGTSSYKFRHAVGCLEALFRVKFYG